MTTRWIYYQCQDDLNPKPRGVPPPQLTYVWVFDEQGEGVTLGYLDEDGRWNVLYTRSWRRFGSHFDDSHVRYWKPLETPSKPRVRKEKATDG